MAIPAGDRSRSAPASPRSTRRPELPCARITPAIRNLIREGQTHQIYSVMQAGAKVGTQTMSQALANLVQRGAITREDALRSSTHPEEVSQLLGSAGGARSPAHSGAR